MPATGQADPAPLLSLLGREFEAFRQFYQILESEQAALIDSDVGRLMTLAQQKNDKAAELTQLGEARSALVRAATGLDNPLAMNAWLKRYDADGRLGAAKRWEALLDLARRAKALNETNGLVINTRLAHNEQALSILMGANASSTRIYGRDGQAYGSTPSGSSGRPLGKA